METIYKLIFFSFCCLLFISLVSIMMVFNGASSTEVSSILSFEKVLLLPTIIYCLSSLVVYLKQVNGMYKLWRRTPGYLIFTLCVINSLSISGFLAFYLVQKKLGNSPEYFEIAPLLVALFSSLALVLSFSFIKRKKPFSSYIDRLQAREDNYTQKN